MASFDEVIYVAVVAGVTVEGKKSSVFYTAVTHKGLFLSVSFLRSIKVLYRIWA
jgi:hypothetical protein